MAKPIPIRETLWDVPIAGYYTYLNKNAAVTIRSANPDIPFALLGITINTKGLAGNTLTLYDGENTSSPVIAVIDTTAVVGTLNHLCRVLHGILTAVMAGGTAADVTIVTS